jgi:putative MFS transporter
VTSTGAAGPPPADRASASSARRIHLHGWRHPAIVAAALLTVAAGFAQFGSSAALGDVARTFGGVEPQGTSVAAKVGLSGTTIGIGLAIIRLASLASLPLAGLADRHGRRRTLLACVAAGLGMTALAALSPSYWWFVVLFASGRPLLSATNAISLVVAAEETTSRDRTKAIALVTAGFGIGAGLTALLRGAFGGHLGFRGLFALALVPLAALPLLARRVEEPDRYQRLRAAADPQAAAARPERLGRVPAGHRRRLLLLGTLQFGLAVVTGPVITFLFVYAENALGMPRSATAAMVLAAGPVGLVGLVGGRWAADVLGRRLTAGSCQVMVALAGIVTYSGSRPAVVGGYLLVIMAGAAYAPSVGALGAELFPTSVRSTVAGWVTAAGVLGAVIGLVAFGRLADALDSFAAAAALVCAPVVAVSLLFALLPETRGLELEQSAPEPAS